MNKKEMMYFILGCVLSSIITFVIMVVTNPAIREVEKATEINVPTDEDIPVYNESNLPHFHRVELVQPKQEDDDIEETKPVEINIKLLESSIDSKIDSKINSKLESLNKSVYDSPVQKQQPVQKPVQPVSKKAEINGIRLMSKIPAKEEYINVDIPEQQNE